MSKQRRYAFEEDFVRVDGGQIAQLEHLYFHNACVQACRRRVLDAIRVTSWTYTGIAPKDLEAHPGFAQFTKRKLKRFLQDAVDAIFVQGFVVYRIENSGRDAMYPFPCVVKPEDDECFVMKKQNNPEDAVSVMKTHDNTKFLLQSQPHLLDKSQNRSERRVTYCYGDTAPDRRTGSVRSVCKSLQYHVSMMQNLEHSAMFIERARSAPYVLTKRKTEHAFDERFLTSDIDHTSDERAMLVMENMHLRDRMDSALQQQKNVDNEVSASQNLVMGTEMYQVSDALYGWSNKPHFVPLPIDADVASTSSVSGRGDLTAMQSNCDNAIKRSFGFVDTDNRSRRKGSANDIESAEMNLSQDRAEALREDIQTLLMDVWTIAYTPIFKNTDPNAVTADIICSSKQSYADRLEDPHA
ncbi:hypothetical protein CYMTET_31810 [Cymbomonas tetramitiformis]|uniref:Uncharacterized protein n=1 Tax=Cymbomonas tetramitiformis TaxID=36881 RepID=A0AAE0FG75_9CHLO|nr:hypothetical protein CYMTET_41429 [Cymbomonas tetramitiformis]KAK3259150.1 hypothetical protein CYMTET_31810 [Cymbomonas tetramitiformis]|eukprot:gene15590-18484_t